MLGIITKEWADMIKSMALFVILKKREGYFPCNFIDEYNDWVHWSSLHVNDPDLVQWCIGYLESAYKCPISLLEEAAKCDGVLR